MKKQRLLKLAALLEADAKNRKGLKFDLGTWGESQKDTPVAVACHTTACAMGLAALSGAFARQGLTYKVSKVSEGDKFLALRQYINIRHGDFVDDEAAASLFGIEMHEAVWLFLPEYYKGTTKGREGELKVAKRIRDFVAGKAWPMQPRVRYNRVGW